MLGTDLVLHEWLLTVFPERGDAEDVWLPLYWLPTAADEAQGL